MGIDKIWVFGEANGDAVASITLEMLAAARELADTIEVFMAGDGDDYAEELGEHGAETVYSTGDLDGGLQGAAVAAAVANAIAEGEVLQLMNRGNPDTDEAAYLDVIDRKTARLFRAATALGAMVAGADEAAIQAARAYGESLGMAFQIIDDLLDYLADPEVSGKNLGTDLAEGKPTLPLIRAMAVGDGATRAFLREALRNGEAADVAGVLRAVESTDAIHYTSAAARRHAADAKAALAALPESAFRNALGGLADFTVARTS